MSEPWSHPELRGTWEISAITDPCAFMRFVFAVAPSGSQWVVVHASDRNTLNRLARIGKFIEKTRWRGFLPKRPYVVVPLTPETQRELDPLLVEVNIAAALIEHHVYQNERVVMCSYDNLSCCWLTKAIGYEVLKNASRTQGFRFTDPDAI